MKIAIATENSDVSSEISAQGARALFFLIFGDNGELLEILENPYADNASRTGPDVANMLHKLHVTKVVAGRFGPKFEAVLKGYHIECIVQTGFAAQVAKALSA